MNTNPNLDKTKEMIIEPYPTSSYEYLGMSQMRKYYLAMIRFTPFIYYPSNGKLVAYNSIKLRINYKIIEDVPEQLFADTAMDDIARDVIFNYQNIAHLYQPSWKSQKDYI